MTIYQRDGTKNRQNMRLDFHYVLGINEHSSIFGIY